MKLISSIIKLTSLVSQETGTIWDYLKTSYRAYARPNDDKTITFYSSGIRKINDTYYDFKFERVYEVSFKTQQDYDEFINKTLPEFDEQIFKGYGDAQ